MNVRPPKMRHPRSRSSVSPTHRRSSRARPTRSLLAVTCYHGRFSCSSQFWRSVLATCLARGLKAPATSISARRRRTFWNPSSSVTANLWPLFPRGPACRVHRASTITSAEGFLYAIRLHDEIQVRKHRAIISRDPLKPSAETMVRRRKITPASAIRLGSLEQKAARG